FLGRPLRGVEDTEVSAARHDIRRVQPPGDFRNAARLVLAVAIEGHQPVVASLYRPLERRAKTGAVSEIAWMPNDLDRRKPCKQARSLVGRTVVDHENVLGMTKHLS